MKIDESIKHIPKPITRIVLVFLGIVMTCQPVLSDEPVPIPESLYELSGKGKLNGVFKMRYFQRAFDGDTPDWATLAIGGNFNYETVPLHGVTAGIGFKTSQGDYLNNGDWVYDGMLAEGATPQDQESYTALDEYFFRYTNWDTQATLGAHAVNTPWLNGHDIRMTPKKYRGFSVINNSIENVELHGYYLTDWLDWTAENFESITSAFTGDTGDDEGVLAGGARWQILPAMNIQAWDYYFSDIMNSFYLRADYTHTMADDYILGADLQYLNQMDVGDQLAGSLGTYTAGGNAFLGGYGATLVLYYGTNGSDNLLLPFGNSKIISLQVLELDRADEDAFAIKLEYAFDNLGLKGLGANIIYGSFDTPDNGANASPDSTEFDFDLYYKLGGWFKLCNIRFRHAIIDQDEDIPGGEDFTDTRLQLGYRF
ncbi:MAG: OprD family outer membrane porin [Deltaproteobacteria bacterium]